METPFPTIEALAEAEEADVLHAWQGLGYYSRARNLHKAAREMVEKYGGAIPEDKKDVRALPGIGEYTAGAILSMAYGKHEAAVDGNVLRVYARLYGIESDILKSAVRKEITTLVEKTLPARAGDFNEALMDLGSEVCVPKHPKCENVLFTESARRSALDWKMYFQSARRRGNRRKTSPAARS